MFIDITDVLVNYKYFLDRWFESFNVNVFFIFNQLYYILILYQLYKLQYKHL